jgi:DNA-binding MarR family transcriptional regulator
MDKHQRLIDGLYAELADFKRVLNGARDQLMGQLGLTRSQIEILMLGAVDAAQTVGDVAKCLAVTHSAATQTIETLVKRGLARRVPDANDRRMVRVELTADGRQLADRLHQARRERVGHVMAGLTDDELILMTSVIKRLAAQFDPATNPKENPRAL